MQVELLYFDGCPHWEQALRELESFLADHHDPAPVTLVPVEGPAEAEQQRFCGSPTIRFNGRDVWPPELETPYGFSCRIYPTSQGAQGVPSRKILEAAYRKTQDSR